MIKSMLCAMALMLAACSSTQGQWVAIKAPVAMVSRSESAPASASASSTFDPSAVSRTCKVDADCEVKNVGNCCGAHRTCVNKDASVDPNAVRAQCQKEHRAGVCSMEAIGGCSCVQGQCSNINAAQMPKKP